jgi:hypothetical protein
LKNLTKEIAEKMRAIESAHKVSIQNNRNDMEVSLYYTFLYKIVTGPLYIQIWSRLSQPLRDQLFKKTND